MAMIRGRPRIKKVVAVIQAALPVLLRSFLVTKAVSQATFFPVATIGYSEILETMRLSGLDPLRFPPKDAIDLERKKRVPNKKAASKTLLSFLFGNFYSRPIFGDL